MASTVVNVKLGDEDLGTFDFEKLTVFDAIQLKAKSQLSTKEFIDGLAQMDGLAMQALVWLLRTRKGAVTELHSINFAIGDLHMEEETVTDPATGQEVAVDPTTPSSGDAAASTSDSSPTSAI